MKRRAFATLIVLALCAGIVLANLDTLRMMLPTRFSDTELIYAQDGVTRYYYHTLSEDAQIAYTLILNAVEAHPEEIEIPPLDDEAFSAMFQALSYDNPSLLCMENESHIVMRGAKAYFVPQYVTDAETCRRQTDDLLEKAREIVAQADSLPDAYDQELYFHDYICQNTTYLTQEDDGYTAYNALVEGRAVCEGYSRALQLLLDMVGVPNYLATGVGVDDNGSREGHMWNIVTIGGSNYHVDATWDDLDAEDIHHYAHTYFNVTDDYIGVNHEEIAPAENNCNAVAANYYVQNGMCFSAYDDACLQDMADAAAQSIQDGTYTIEVWFTNEQAYLEAAADLTENQAVYEVLYLADRRVAEQVDEVVYVRSDVTRTLQFAFE